LILKLNPSKISEQKINVIVDALKNGGLIVFPTDTVYAFGGDPFQPKAIERLIRLSGKKRPDFSFICDDMKQAQEFTAGLDTPVFKEMKRLLPGPFTIIVNASHQVARLFQTNKKTVGIRIPQNDIARVIAKSLGHPIISTSLHDEDVILDYITDPVEIENRFHGRVAIVVDGGMGGNLPSTVIDYTQATPFLVRAGAGVWDGLDLPVRK
jgi:tRNA threonylcarbamoyl adenosine modification protein (Sua5/YciO/YrdC/YwlC family)